MAKATKLDSATLTGLPSASGSRPSSSRARVSSAVLGSDMIFSATLGRVLAIEALRPVDELELLLLLLGLVAQLAGLHLDLATEQVALAGHADVLAGGHREGTRQQACDTGEQDGAVVGRCAGEAHDKRRVGHQPVADPEDGGARRSGPVTAMPWLARHRDPSGAAAAPTHQAPMTCASAGTPRCARARPRTSTWGPRARRRTCQRRRPRPPRGAAARRRSPRHGLARRGRHPRDRARTAARGTSTPFS